MADDVLLPGACVGNAMTRLWGQGMNGGPPCAPSRQTSPHRRRLPGLFGTDLLVDRDDMATGPIHPPSTRSGS